MPSPGQSLPACFAPENRLPRSSSPTNLVLVSTTVNSPNPSSSSRRGSSASMPAATSSNSQESDDFDEWLRAYAAGRLGPADRTPAPPPAIAAIIAEESQSSSASPSSPASSSKEEMYLLRGNSSGMSVDALEEPSALEQYRLRGHLMAPKAPFEADRLKLASKFGLDQPRRRAALDAICRVVKRVFKMKTVVISLTFDDHQVLAGEVGWGAVEPGPDEPPRPLTLEPAMCTHAILSASNGQQPFIVGDANNDWRFRRSPYTTGMGGGLAYYAAANVMLDVDDKDQIEKDLPSQLPVGALCLIDDQPRDPDTFTEEDRATLRDFAQMIARELTLGHEQRRRETETKQSNFLGEFLNTAIILPDKATAESTRSRTTNLQPSTSDNPSVPSAPGAKASPATQAVLAPTLPPTTAPETTFNVAASNLKDLTSATSSAIIDLRSFRSPVFDDDRKSPSAPPQQRQSNGNLGGRGKLYLMGHAGVVKWEDVMTQESLMDAVADVLTEYHASSTTIFDRSSRVQPFRGALPSSVTSSVCLPLFDVDGTPSLLLVLTSDRAHFTFVDPDVRFARNVGAVAMGYLLRQRAMEADRAKLAFVSQISHELRTPLHGINSQVELIREFSTPSQLRRLAPMLDCAEICLESLRDVLDDTLDFAKLTSSSSTAAEMQQAHERALAPTNLEQLLEDVSKATWVRKKRTDLVTADAGTPKDGIPPTPAPLVKLILELEHRSSWMAMTDSGAFKRVLLNLLGNSLKFTKQGHVKLALREMTGRAADPKKSMVRLEIEDTGCGMSEHFLRTKLFVPFVQENPFANGAGLGMSICQTIIRRMGGDIDVRSVLGKGTTIAITLPIEFLPSPSSDSATPTSSTLSTPTPTPTRSRLSPGLIRTRIISQELATLFNPGPAHLVNSVSPGHEPKELDFSQAVEAAQSSSTLVRMPSSRTRPRRGSVVGRRGDVDDLVVEAAKLGFSTAVVEEEGRESSSESPPEKAGAELGSSAAAASQAGRKVRVLVADDNPIARNIFTKLFTNKGIDFEQAEDGLEAVELFKAADARGQPFDLYCTDVQMPRMDGAEASFEIRRYEAERGLPRCRIIALTGLSNEEDMRSAGVIEADGPIDSWVVKGGKSMRVVLDEVATLQRELDDPTGGEA